MSTKSSDKEYIKKIKEIPDKPLFNSKLFIDLNINEEDLDELNENENSDINTEGSDNSFELEESNYLSNELIEELDLDYCNNNSNPPKEENNTVNNKKIVDSLLSLANNGYEFKPKNFKPSYTKNPMFFNKNININNNDNLNAKNKIYFYNNNNIREQKKNWICSFCKNLNYSFRTKCNRCKVKKEDSDKRNIFLMHFAI